MTGIKMAKWRNWSGKQVSRPQQLYHIRSQAHAQALVAKCNDNGASLRVAGAGHSHMPLVPSKQVIADLSGLSGIIDIDKTNKTASLWAGTPIYALGQVLQNSGLALFNQGDIDRQSIAGAVATGTHGTGAKLQNLSASVIAMNIVLASGELIKCDAENNSQLWQAARINLGAVGLVTQLQLQLRDAYKLQEKNWSEDLDSLLPKIDDLIKSNRHFEFFWSPETNLASAKTLNETDSPAHYPLQDEQSRCAWNYEVLANYRPHLHTEMEYSVPAQHGPICLLAIRELIRKDFPQLRWPVEYRTMAADDLWLSTANDRATVTISIHQGIDENDEDLFRACEKIFLSFDGRPHWGKVNYLDGDRLANCHQHWSQWWQVRNHVDPKKTFINDYLASLY